jgi:hypothetical protein
MTMFDWMLQNVGQLVEMILEDRSMSSPRVDALLSEAIYMDQRTRRQAFQILKGKLAARDKILAEELLSHIKVGG